MKYYGMLKCIIAPPQSMDLISYLKQSNWLNIDINADLQFNIKRQSNAILYISRRNTVQETSLF